MAFTSDLGTCPVITDENYEEFLSETGSRGGMGVRGYLKRNYEDYPDGSLKSLRRFDLPIIPRDEWADRIEEREKTRVGLSRLWTVYELLVLSQGRTNYCWINGVVHAMMATRAFTNMPFVSLSPAWTGAKIKNYRNVGGWGGEAIEGINRYGIPDVQFCPPNAIDRRYDTPEARANAALHKIPEQYELQDRNFDQTMTALILGFAVPAGLSWWGHLVCFLDPVVISPRRYGVKFINSWSANWGDHGFGVLEESKARPDDQQALRSITVSRT